MKKVLGIPLGSHSGVFELMKAYNIDIDYICENDLELLEKPTIGKQFSNLERSSLEKGRISEYFKQVHDIPDFWSKYIEKSSVILTKPYYSQVLKEDTNFKFGLGDVDYYDIIAISATDNYYKPLESLLTYLNENWDKPVVLGGQIVRKNTLPKIEKFSENCLINLGSFEKFLKFVKNNTTPRTGTIGNGNILKIDSDKILKKAGYAKVDEFHSEKRDSGGVTYISEGDVATFNIFGISKCGNGCDYCCSPVSCTVSEDIWINSIKDLSQENNRVYLDIRDDNPLKHTNSYNKIVSEATDRFKHIMLNTYLDPSTLIMLPEAESFLDKLISNPKTEKLIFFIGRECVDEESARKLGRKYNGMIRNQELLDKEKGKIKDVIKKLDKKEIGYKMHIAYVLGPYNNGVLDRIKKEAEDFVYTNNNDIGEISAHIQSLDVFPGTQCYERYKDNLVSDFPGVSISNLENDTIRDFEREDFGC